MFAYLIMLSLAIAAAAARPMETTVHAETETFSYDPHSGIGPSDWGTIPGYEACGTGTSQSPIDIRVGDMETVPMSEGPVPSFGETELHFVRTTENFEMDCEEEGTCGFTMYNGERFNLVNIHFHSKSEHMFQGRQTELGCHMVHSSESGELLVIGTFFRVAPRRSRGEGNPVFEEILEQLEAGETSIKVDLSELLGERGYVGYSGSLTTPPCTEGVNWFIAIQTQPASMDQVNRYRAIAKSGPYGNNRPVHELNGRGITTFVEDG